jgi:hypothetical protein
MAGQLIRAFRDILIGSLLVYILIGFIVAVLYMLA